MRPAASGAKRQKADFFVSRNGADAAWAKWIAWQLESAGYRVVVQDWDFGAGTNFVLKMDDAIAGSERTIVVLSPDFLKSEFTAPEWAAAFADDPKGAKQKLVPIKVRPCTPIGLLRPLVRIDLLGLDEETATVKLLAEVKIGRGKPAIAPPFPGSTRRRKPPFPGLKDPAPAPSTGGRRAAVPEASGPPSTTVAMSTKEALDRIGKHRWGAAADKRWESASSGTWLGAVLVPSNQQRLYLSVLELGDQTLQARLRELALVGASAVLRTERGTQTDEALDHLMLSQHRDRAGQTEAVLEIHTDGTLVYRLDLDARSEDSSLSSRSSRYSLADGHVVDEQMVRAAVAAFVRFGNGFYRLRRRDSGVVHLGSSLSGIDHKYFGRRLEVGLSSYTLASHRLDDPLHVPDPPLALTAEQRRAPDSVAKTVVDHYARRFRLEGAYRPPVVKG